jgi:hypothetical protein
MVLRSTIGLYKLILSTDGISELLGMSESFGISELLGIS